MTSQVGRYKARREEEQFRKKPKRKAPDGCESIPVESILRQDLLCLHAYGAWRMVRVRGTNRSGNTVWLMCLTEGGAETTFIFRAERDRVWRKM